MPQKPRWDDESVKALARRAHVPGRSVQAQRSKRTRLGLRTPRAPRLRWKKHELVLLEDLHYQGQSARVICASGVLPHSQNAIQKQLGRMGLSKKVKIVKFSLALRTKFKKFLQEHWEGKTPEDLTVLWNAQPAVPPVTKRKIISYLTKLNLKIAYGEVQQINALRKREQKIRQSGLPLSDANEKIRLERVKFMRRRLARKKDIWTGMPLPDDIDNLNDFTETSHDRAPA